MKHLVQQIKNGDIGAFEIFYKAEFDNLVFFSRNYLRDSGYAEDIAQESLLTLWECRDLIDETKNIRAFAFTIAKNKTLNILKSKYHKTHKSDLTELKANISALHEISNSFDVLLLEELIEKTYKNLPKTVKNSFIFSRKHGLTNVESAEKQGVSVRSVEYHISIALKIFKKTLKEYIA